jgi:methionyl-tRNA formyltransferase
MRIACIGYRKWALNIYDSLEKSTSDTYYIIRSKLDFDELLLRNFNPDLILFYGWSWRVSEELLSDFICLMLHPSPLPKYRGGSPIQNQIILGEKKSKVSIFIMNSEIDAGDIVEQESISLEGSIDRIFQEIERVGIRLTLDLIRNGMNPWPQDNNNASYFKRRTEADSEITLDEISGKSAQYLYNKIRMLNDPYPNAFIKTQDGKKLMLITAKIEDD